MIRVGKTGGVVQEIVQSDGRSTFSAEVWQVGRHTVSQLQLAFLHQLQH